MTTLQQIFNLITGLVSTIMIVSVIIGGAFWLSNKMNENDRHKRNS
jgi:type IV secretory pathway VirB2 component (pilin)